MVFRREKTFIRYKGKWARHGRRMEKREENSLNSWTDLFPLIKYLDVQLPSQIGHFTKSQYNCSCKLSIKKPYLNRMNYKFFIKVSFKNDVCKLVFNLVPEPNPSIRIQEYIDRDIHNLVYLKSTTLIPNLSPLLSSLLFLVFQLTHQQEQQK